MFSPGELSKEEARDAAFEFLSGGVEMTSYDVYGVPSSKKRAVWLEQKYLRICVDSKKQEKSALGRGKVPPGVCLRDIAEIRIGCNAHNFSKADQAKLNPDCCLVIIGSERTLCLQTSTKFSRDLFLKHLGVVIEHNMSEVERLYRDRMRIIPAYAERSEAKFLYLKRILEVGVMILHHTVSGKVVRSKLFYNSSDGTINVTSEQHSFFGASRSSSSLLLNDVAEIRPGTHSVGFVRSNSLSNQSKCFSIITSEGTLDIECSSLDVRNLLVVKLRSLISYIRGSDDDITGSVNTDPPAAAALTTPS